MHLGFQSNWHDTCWEWFGCLSNFFTGHTTLCSTWWVLEADRSSRQATRGHGMVAFTGSHLSWEPWHWLNTGVLFSFFLCQVSVAVWEKKLGSTLLVLDEMFLQKTKCSYLSKKHMKVLVMIYSDFTFCSCRDIGPSLVIRSWWVMHTFLLTLAR
jgi:hypothetical protein